MPDEPQIIRYKGVEHRFPASFTQAQIAQALKTWDAQPAAAAAAPPGPLARAWAQAGPRLNPINLATGLYQGAQEAVQTAQRDPRYLGSPALAFGAQAAAGLVGEVKDAYTLAREGDLAGAGGIVGANVALMAGPKVVSKVVPRSVPISLGLRQAPEMAEPLRVARQQGIPVDLATVTDSPWVARATKTAAASSLPAGVAYENVQTGVSTAVKGAMDRLAGRAGAGPVSEAAAGEAAQNALVRRQTQLGRQADVNYETFRSIEADPRYRRAVPMQIAMTAPDGSVVMQRRMVPMQLPVDLRPVQAALRPLVKEIERRSTLVEAQASPGLNAMQNILDLPEFVPASAAEVELGALKAVARKGGQTGRSQGLALRAVRSLQREIDKTIRQVGDPRAQLALQSGRRLTAAKYYAGRLLELVEGRRVQATIGAGADAGRVAEPVGVFRKLTRSDDQSIKLLRRVLRREPGLKPDLARAVVDRLFEDAFDTRKLGHTDRIFSGWQKLGDGTKRLLYSPSLLKDLDGFFLLLKKLKYEPNPSGSGYIVSAGAGLATLTGVVEPLTFFLAQIGPYGLVKLAHSPRAIRALTRAGQVALRPRATRATVAAVVGHLERVAADVGVRPGATPSALPLAADEGEPDR